MEIQVISINALHAHPSNSNVMSPEMLAKLGRHIENTGRYPPIVVRPHKAGYQVLDGHHRIAALRQLGHESARCVVWDVDDEEALLLLATLNRLQGQDDPRKRAALLAELNASQSLKELATKLPETRKRLEQLMKLNAPPPAPRPTSITAQMPVAVHFFLLPRQKRSLEARLKEIGPTREAALMRLVEARAGVATEESHHGQADQ